MKGAASHAGPRATVAVAFVSAGAGLLIVAAPAGCILPAPGAVAPAASSGSGAPDTGPTLRAAVASTGKLIGAAVDVGALRGEAGYRQVLAAEFDYVTPENVMKWGPIHPSPDRFDFAAGDALVAFAAEHGMKVKGHTLVWHNQLPPWVAPLDAGALRAALERHIRAVVGHYRGRLVAWDVVNEALDDQGGPRPSVFQQKLGPSYIADAFRWAHEADPQALLFYNDYNTEGAGPKSDAAYALVQGLLAQGVPVAGVGLQMHIRARGDATPADIARNMERLAQLGLLVNVSEMDVRIRELPGSKAGRLEVQRQTFHDVVAVCLAQPRCHAVTMWGFTDAHSWVDNFFGADDPLPFDERYRRKPAYYGIQAALLGR